MATLFANPRYTPVDAQGDPYPGATLTFYAAGTTTPQAVYTTSALTTPHPSPVTANSAGQFPPIYYDDALQYRALLRDATGVLLWDIDLINSSLTAEEIGRALYTRTTAEISAGVTPTAYRYPPGDVRRYGAVGNGVADDTAAFTAALRVADAYVPFGTYRISSTLALSEFGIIGQGWGSSGTAQKAILMFYNLTSTTQGAIYTDYANWKGRKLPLQSFAMRASSWNASTGALGYGLNITAPVFIRDVEVAGFAKSGAFFHNTATDGQAPYESLIENLECLYNGEHGIIVGTGANSLTFINPVAKWNGTPSYLTAPSVAGNFDGFLIDYQNAANPGGAFFSYVPEGTYIIGGDCSYNSRYGWNFTAIQNGFLTPNYAELNLQSAPGQVNLGSGVTNCFIALASIGGRTAGVNFAMPASGSSLGSNTVYVGGRDCGAGDSNTETSRTGMSLARRLSYVGHNNDFSNAAYITGNTSGVATLAAVGSGYWDLNNPLRYSGTQVLGARRTGWGAPSGTATRTTFDTSTVTATQLAERVKALIDDLTTHGIIGS